MIRDIFSSRGVVDQIRQSLLHVRDRNIRGVFDSLSSVILVADNFKAPISLLSQIIANNKANQHNNIFTIHADVHEKYIIKALEHYADGVLKLTYNDEGKPILRIVKAEGYGRIETNEFLYLPEPGKVVLEPI